MKPFALLFLALTLLVACGPTTENSSLSKLRDGLEPRSRSDGTPWRVAVLQSGDYQFYNSVLASLHSGLADLGWTSSTRAETVVTDDRIPAMLTRWQPKAGHILFDPALFADLSFEERWPPSPQVLALLDGSAGADLVISLGTVAGRLAARAAKEGLVKVPVMIESVSDPVGSAIIPSLDDSGHDLLTASTDPTQYERQVRLFHQVVGFKRLGLVYTDTDAGRAYAALEAVRKVANEEGFTLVEDTGALEDPPDPSQIPLAEQAYLQALERLVTKKVDAVYLAIQAGLTLRNMPQIRAITDAAKVPTFAMEGTEFVLRGALLGESSNVLTIEGLAGARKLTRILTGTTPRTLPQSIAHMSHVAVNAETAKKIGFEVPVDVMLQADEVYTMVK